MPGSPILQIADYLSEVQRIYASGSDSPNPIKQDDLLLQISKLAGICFQRG